MSIVQANSGNIESIRNCKVIAIEPGGDAKTSSLAHNWNRDPSWLWPPPLYQAYCKLHFLKECSLYHLWETECFELKIETHVPKTKKTNKWPTAPTRVQPSRRAREKKLKDKSETPISRQSSPARDSKTDGVSNPLEVRREQLRLHLSWPIYKTQLEDRIKQVFDGLQANEQDSADTNSSFHSDIDLRLECRYCRFDSVVVGCKGSAPRRLAPPAPMYCIQPDEINEGRIGTFGGIKFAVGLSGEHKAIILLGMEKFDDSVG
ncbi:hypothetical protein F4774DRAFT_213859 [Daldinia eschscholtzii]|nr:hypothetical protein F4774DRAFT_213859 [Daldinia eschscholtzii]